MAELIKKKTDDKGHELIEVRITRQEMLLLPVETRRRILAEQADEYVKKYAGNSCEASAMD